MGLPGPEPAGIPETSEKPDPDHVLTWRQRKVLQVIRESVRERGYPPSIREIGEAVGLTSKSSVSHHLRTLRRKGYLHWDAGRPRTLGVRGYGHPAARPETGQEEDGAAEIPGVDVPPREVAYVPVIGRIAAGEPIPAGQHVEGLLPLPRQLVGEGPLVLMKVAGDSMTGAAITDGDWVVVQRRPLARDGDLVAADIDGVPTVRTYKQSDGHVWLIPNHPAYSPISGDKADILGRVVTILRAV